MTQKIFTTFRALRGRNFRLFFFGQGVSLIGSWVTRVAMSWLVYRLTDSAAWLGIVAFATQIPAFLLSPIAGILIDRWDKRRVLVITQFLFMAQALSLAFLSLTGMINVWHILGLGIFQGLALSVDIPCRQAFVVEMIDRREDLGNAIALNSSLFNFARLVGPATAGLLIAVVGEGVCFLLDGISYAAVIASLLAMRLAAREAQKKKVYLWPEFREGFRHSFGFLPVRTILLLVASISFMGFSALVLLPVFARSILSGGPQMFGFLTASTGFGALAGGLFLASRDSVLGLGRTLTRAGMAGGAALIGFSLSSDYRLSMLFLFISSFGLLVQMASCNTIVQTIVDDNKRGRVMSFYTMSFLGMAPMGSLAMGTFADWAGARSAVAIGGAACILAAWSFRRKLPVLREIIRPIYVRKGILPEIAAGIESASNRLTAAPD